MVNFVDPLNIEKVVLPVEEFALDYRIPLSNIRVTSNMDIYRGEICLQMVRRIATLPGEKIIICEDWWQQFKKQFAPEWFKKKYPVKGIQYQAKAYFTNLAIPEDKYNIEMLWIKDSNYV